MSSMWVFLAYGSAMLAAALVLYFFHARAWYWHAISVALALAIGWMPMPAEMQGPQFDLLVGSVFLFLMAWGAGGPLFRYAERHAHS